MNIDLDLSDGGPVLRDPSDFEGFKVVVRGGRDRDRDRAGAALAGVAEWVDDDHVAVSADALRALAGPVAETEEWRDGFAAMLAYAKSKGWVVGDAIRAHVEWDG